MQDPAKKMIREIQAMGPRTNSYKSINIPFENYKPTLINAFRDKSGGRVVIILPPVHVFFKVASIS